MSAARLSSAALRTATRRAAPRGVRFSSGGPEHHGHNPAHLPFSYKNRGPFIAKLSVFSVVGFGLPFWLARYQMKKSGAM
ncbi:cytochrome c oxidase subunit VIIc [Phanerochaete sordida]|uniref:Cytochrome c oxidase subunit 8, mitochondrial n=1 Tax=Phanerochaete sordida TaxID=48140 RepID=A0A9P3LF46_9APHY|nr:cytochrome c oxidase subunit VIIc [Phanerochaete sordida]